MCVHACACEVLRTHTHTHTLSLSLKKKKKFTQRAKRQGGGDKQKRAVGQVRKCAVKMVAKYAYGPRFKCACIALEEKKILVKCLHWPHFDGTGFWILLQCHSQGLLKRLGFVDLHANFCRDLLRSQKRPNPEAKRPIEEQKRPTWEFLQRFGLIVKSGTDVATTQFTLHFTTHFATLNNTLCRCCYRRRLLLSSKLPI